MPQTKGIAFGQKDIDRIVKTATDSLAKKFGLDAAHLPSDIKDAIQTTAKTIASDRARTLIQKDVDTAVKAELLKGAKPLEVLGERMAAASTGIAQIAQDLKVEGILADTAKLLWKKYTALKTAGFSEPQAFDLLIAEVKGRSGRAG
jgi:hypothetical protein